MTDEEFAEWGAREDARRKVDLVGVDSATALKTAQQAAMIRRQAVGLTASQAVRAITVARRVARGDSLSFAFRR